MKHTTLHKNNIVLSGLLAIHALSATIGGLSLMAGKVDVPLSWLVNTGFTSYYFPGVILFAVVGGSALFALLAYVKRLSLAPYLSLLSGIIMLFWILGEMVSIGQIHILQIVYLITALAVIALTPKHV